MASGLRTTVVGSWWPIPEFEEDLRRYHAGELSAEDGDALLSRAATQAIEEQRDLGLTEWTGGELFTYEFIEHIQRVLTGIEIVVPTKAELFDYDDMALARITGELTAPNGLGYADGYVRERELPAAFPRRLSSGRSRWRSTSSTSSTVSRDRWETSSRSSTTSCSLSPPPGCPHIQLDVPAFSTLITNGAMTADEAANIIAQCFEGVRAERRGIHICSGNLRGRPLAGNLTSAPWVDILERLDGVIDIAHLALHYFNRYLERDMYARVPQSIEIAAGIVDEGCYYVEPVSKIRERAADWARVIGEERLWLAPSCGFGRHTPREIPVLREKLENMVEAASSL